MSEPVTKIAEVGGCTASHLIDEKAKFFVILCGDVLIEMLCCGDRFQLVKLERLGRKFHWLIEKFFGETPFLRLYPHLEPGHSGLKGFIEQHKYREQKPLRDLSTCPGFLRFDKVALSIYELRHLFVKQLKTFVETFKPALNHTKKIRINATIYENQEDFYDHSQLVNYLSSELLQICGSSECYKFYIYFVSDEESVSEVIGSILQIEQVKRSPNVEIDFYCDKLTQNHQLPIGIISNWLNEKPDWIDQKQRNDEKFLRIRSIHVKGIGIDRFFGYIQNDRELANHLQEAFEQAESPVFPFTVYLWHCYPTNEIEEKQKQITNEKTNEELTIRKSFTDLLIIRGARMEKMD